MKLGFIGIGKIASAVISGFCTSNIKDLIIKLSPRNEENSNNLAKKFPFVERLTGNQLVLDQSDIIFIALIPNMAKKILRNLEFRKDHIIISLIPYLKYPQLVKAAEPATKLSRAIPLPTVVNHNCPIPIFNSNKTVTKIFSHIGQPLHIATEEQLHTIWTLTGLITPFYDLLSELSSWARSNGVNENIANKYIADLFQSLSFTAQKTNPVNFNELAKHAATPNGMNEQAGKEIFEKGAHQAYKIAADNLLRKFLEKL